MGELNNLISFLAISENTQNFSVFKLDNYTRITGVYNDNYYAFGIFKGSVEISPTTRNKEEIENIIKKYNLFLKVEI